MFKRLRKWLLGAGILFLVVLVGAWFGLPRLAEWWLPDLARQHGVEEFSLDLGGMGWRGLSLRRVRGVLPAAQGAVQLVARDALLRLGPDENGLFKLDIDRLYVRWQQQSAEAAPSTPMTPPDLPLAQLHVRQLQLDLDTDAGHVGWQGELTLAHPVPGWYTAGLSDAAYRLTAKLRSSLTDGQITLRDSAGQPVLEARVGALLDPDRGASLDVHIAPLRRWALDSGWLPSDLPAQIEDLPALQARARLQRSASGDTVTYAIQLDDLDLAMPEGVLQGGVRAEAVQVGSKWNVRTTAASTLQFRPAPQLAALKGPQRLSLGQGLRVRFQLHDGQVRDLRGDGPLKVDVQVQDRRLQSSLVSWRIPRWSSSDTIPGQGELRVEHLRISGLQDRLPELAAEGSWHLHGKELVAQGKAGPQGDLWTDWQLWHWLARGDGYLDATVKQPLVRLWPVLSKLGGVKDLSVDGGDLDVKLHVGWQHDRGLSGRAEYSATGVAGGVAELRFQELELTGTAVDLFQPSLGVSALLPRLVLGSGIEVRNLRVAGGLDHTLLSLRDASLAVFSGDLAMSAVERDLDRPMPPLQLNARHISLTQLFAAFAGDALTGTGFLSGQLPVTIDGQSLTVRDARLSAEGKGIVRYSGPGSALQAENPNIALRALENFHYETLDARLDYAPDGAYHLRITLLGTNPDLYSGAPIRLNLNLEGVLPGLLRAVLLTGDFSREILRQIQQGVDPESLGTAPGKP